MKYFVLIITLFFGISLSSSASFFNEVSFNIPTRKNIFQIKKGTIQKPLFVWNNGRYHPITTPTAPFYSNDIFENHLVIRKILKPNELGTLWMSTFAQGTHLIKDNYLLDSFYRTRTKVSEGLYLQQNIRWNSFEKIKKSKNWISNGLLER